MALYAQFMFRMALELAQHDPVYEDEAIVFFDHFVNIAGAMDRVGVHDDEMWDADDGFFYDVLRFPDGNGIRLKVRSLVGLLPLCAATTIERKLLEKLTRLHARYRELAESGAEQLHNIACPATPGEQDRHLLAVLDEDKLRRVLGRMLDESEFFGPYGIRSLSRAHADEPYCFKWGDQQYVVHYLPGESDTGMFGGNSNWRGPVWMPANFMIIRGLLNLYVYYGDSFRIECPTGSGNEMTLFEVKQELSRRLVAIFLRDEQGRRPLYGQCEPFQSDPHWRDLILFYEYFHGDDGSGLGAGHQTGWTGLIAVILALLEKLDPEAAIADAGKAAAEALEGND
jgi:hypothetical protein